MNLQIKTKSSLKITHINNRPYIFRYFNNKYYLLGIVADDVLIMDEDEFSKHAHGEQIEYTLSQ